MLISNFLFLNKKTLFRINQEVDSLFQRKGAEEMKKLQRKKFISLEAAAKKVSPRQQKLGPKLNNMFRAGQKSDPGSVA